MPPEVDAAKERGEVSSAIWLGHELVAFGSDACENCGNGRLRHLHRIRMEGGRTLREACRGKGIVRGRQMNRDTKLDIGRS